MMQYSPVIFLIFFLAGLWALDPIATKVLHGNIKIKKEIPKLATFSIVVFAFSLIILR